MFFKPFTALSVIVVSLAAPVDLDKRAWPRGNVTCGSNVLTLSQVQSAVSAGFARRNSPIGSNSYPHRFNNFEGLDMWCTGKSSFMEWPILRSGTYTGASPGADRVVFSADDGTYCAVITHTGASSNGFVSCDGD